MNTILSSEKIYIAQSTIPGAGRGVFARVNIQKGERIERCPTIELPEHDTPSINESILVTYIYYLGKDKNRLVLALGFGSIYNHSPEPNARYKDRQEEGVIDFIAIRDIKKNEEITVKYNQGDQKDTSPLWFTV